MKTTKRNLIRKLHPSRYPNMSGKMVALLACILDQDWTDPKINQMIVTSDGFLLAQLCGHCGFDDFVGTQSELRSNWNNLLKVAKLSQAESKLAEQLYAEVVKSAVLAPVLV